MTKVQRLADKIKPVSYRLDFDIDIERFSFSAKEQVTFDLSEPSARLVFHAASLQIDSAKLGTGETPTSIVHSEKDQTVTFEFAQVIKAGAHDLAIELRGEINDKLHGLYRSSYAFEGAVKWLATTQFEPIAAREVFVCIDEPIAKAEFELSLTVAEHLTALSNTSVVSETETGSGQKTVKFARTPKMSTYLVAFVVGEFEYVDTKTTSGLPVRVYATPGQTSQLGFALETTVRGLAFFEDYYGIKYPLPKLDMIAVPDFAAGAMENWGLVIYRDTALLLDQAQTSLSSKQRVAQVILHELAHQWFGDLVTMTWWDDLWLNEGFASWMEPLATNALFPDWHVWTDYVSSEFSRAMSLDGLANTHPIQVQVDDPSALDEIFDAVSYSKGSSIINMVHRFIGPEPFRKGLHIYLSSHTYANSTTNDLWRALEAASGKPIDDLMSVWTKQPGYPIVAYEDGTATQKRFYASAHEAAKRGDTATQLWPIPWSAKLSDGTTTKPNIMLGASNDLPDAVMSSGWFKPNPGQTGFYRSLYTEPMIEALTGPLKEGTLDATDRFGVLNDVLAACEAGLTTAATALRLAEVLREESDYVAWGAVTSILSAISATVEDEATREDLDKFGRWLVKPNANRLGWGPEADESAFDTLMRPLVLQQAIRYDDVATLEEGLALYDDLLSGASIHPDLRTPILYAAARRGQAEDFDKMLELFRKEALPQLKISLLGTLGRFRDPKLIARYLDLGLSKDVRAQDMYIVIARAFQNRYGREIAWEWLKSNWVELLRRYGSGGHMLERMPMYAATAFATKAKASEIKDFFDANPHPSLVRPAAQAIETVTLKADWFDRDEQNITQFLDDWRTRTGSTDL